IDRVWQGDGEALAEGTIQEGITDELSHYLFHPALSDSAANILVATIPLDKDKSEDRLDRAFVSAGFKEVRIYRRPACIRFQDYAKIRPEEVALGNILTGDVQVFDSSGNLVAETLGMRLAYLEAAKKHEVLGKCRAEILTAQPERRRDMVGNYLRQEIA